MVHIIPCRSIECIDLNCFQQLPCVRYFTVPSVCLEGCWKTLLSSIAVILCGWYNADWKVVLIFFFFFSCTGWKWKKDIYINNYNCNKPAKATDHQCWCSVFSQCGVNKPASGTYLHSNHHPGNISASAVPSTKTEREMESCSITVQTNWDAAIRSAAVRIKDTWILIGSAAVRIVARGFLLAQGLCE